MKKGTKKYSTKPVNTKLSFFLIPLVLAAFTLLPTAQAQLSPPPDGGYADNNTAEGTDALFSLTTGPDNTAVGFEALYSNTTGDSNTATGSQALVSNTTGIRNTATGRAALTNNTTGNHNTANGHNALIFNSTGNDNTATGSFALVFNTIGNQNIALGNFARQQSHHGEQQYRYREPGCYCRGQHDPDRYTRNPDKNLHRWYQWNRSNGCCR